MFGEGDHALVLPLRRGLTTLVGENDSGKTAVIDALRLALGTRDQESFRIEETDFHQSRDGSPGTRDIRIRCRFEDLEPREAAVFIELLTYEKRGSVTVPILFVNWTAAKRRSRQRNYTAVEVKSGERGDGPWLDADAKSFLSATYLRPLRDAQRAMSAGRGSRLSQILQYTREVRDQGRAYDPTSPIEPEKLSVLGIGDYANALLAKHPGVTEAQARLNSDYLDRLFFDGEQLHGTVSVSGARGDEDVRLRALLEKLELDLRESTFAEPPPTRGLGSNNLLFMACELLLLGSEDDGYRLLLIEEPEAHLHPQRQLRLMRFLQEQARPGPEGRQQIQVVVTTHSPNLASAAELGSMVLMQGGKAFPLAVGETKLRPSDYGFLQRFLDVTKANLFFARGVVIVEGDAESIILPTLARLIGRDFTANGVSIVNVGSTGLGRFARIFQRRNPEKNGVVEVPVACIADLDVMPDCAPEILNRAEPGHSLPEIGTRQWRVKSDFQNDELDTRREKIRARASGQRVETFVSDHWTLEYDLAYSGLGEKVWMAIQLAAQDEAIHGGRKTMKEVADDAARSFADLVNNSGFANEVLASKVYARLAGPSASVSKTIAAQYLAFLLEEEYAAGQLEPEVLRAKLPTYLIDAIEYVTPQSAVAVAQLGAEGREVSTILTGEHRARS